MNGRSMCGPLARLCMRIPLVHPRKRCFLLTFYLTHRVRERARRRAEKARSSQAPDKVEQGRRPSETPRYGSQRLALAASLGSKDVRSSASRSSAVLATEANASKLSPSLRVRHCSVLIKSGM